MSEVKKEETIDEVKKQLSEMEKERDAYKQQLFLNQDEKRVLLNLNLNLMEQMAKWQSRAELAIQELQNQQR
jgi:hypothetical protein